MTPVPEDHVRNIDETVTILLDLLKIGAAFYPPLAVASPFVSFFIEQEAAKLKTGVMSGTIVSDGRGGFVTTEWATDPRHALNPDGSFKY